MVGSLVSRDTGKTGHTGLPFTVRASLARILGGIQTSYPYIVSAKYTEWANPK
jgi:hypothetical protein